MKFDCGDTYQVAWNKKRNRLENWHRFFAIFPRRVGERECRWLEWIERRGTYDCGYDADGWNWEYRAIESSNHE